VSAQAPPADVRLERRQGRLAGLAAFTSVACSFAALVLALGAVQPGADGRVARGGREAMQYLQFDESRGAAAVSVSLRMLGVLLVIVVAVFLDRAIRARAADVPRFLRGLAIGAPVAVALASLTGFLAFSGVVDAFLDSGLRTNERARAVAADDALYRIQQVAQIAAQLALAAWLGLVCAAGLAVGLLPKFLAYYGYGAAVALVLAPFAGDALFLGWLGSIGLMTADAWPGGRPPAWESGRAERPT